MSHMPATITPEHWLEQIFIAKSACQGGVVRRKARDIDRIVGRALFMKELERRGYHAVENAGQVVIFCNNEALRIIR